MFKREILPRLIAVLVVLAVFTVFGLYYFGFYDVSFFDRPEAWEDNLEKTYEFFSQEPTYIK